LTPLLTIPLCAHNRTFLEDPAARPGALLRFVTETTQGIVPARNRAIEESLDNSDTLVFIDDELPAYPRILFGIPPFPVTQGAGYEAHRAARRVAAGDECDPCHGRHGGLCRTPQVLNP